MLGGGGCKARARTVVARACSVVVVVRLGLGQWLLEHARW